MCCPSQGGGQRRQINLSQGGTEFRPVPAGRREHLFDALVGFPSLTVATGFVEELANVGR